MIKVSRINHNIFMEKCCDLMSVYLFLNLNRIDAFCPVSKNEKNLTFETGGYMKIITRDA